MEAAAHLSAERVEDVGDVGDGRDVVVGGEEGVAAALGDVIEGRACAADLAEAWNPVSDGAEIGAGTLQQLQADACTNAAMAANMSREAGWDALATLLEGLSKELDGGAVRELAGLMEVARDGVFGFAMTAARARALYKAGIRSPEEAASAGEDDLAAMKEHGGKLRDQVRAKRNEYLETVSH